jgi:murein DD-endopeptidase MepM/ murein hydrolase activator NlpD
MPDTCKIGRQGTTLDHGKLRGPNRARIAPEGVDLGNEPPLSVDGGTGGMVDRRRVSVQWFSGTILTGVCGAALMGGAVFTALDGETNFATMPERIESGLRGRFDGMGERLSAIRKSDRLPPMPEVNVARYTFKISTTSRVGDREVVRPRLYVRIAANLALTATELTANLPRFNAQKVLAAAGVEDTVAEDNSGAEPDAEVSFVTRDLAELLPRAKLAATIAPDDIIVRVRDIANANAILQARGLTGDALAGARLVYANEGDRDLGSNFRARIFPENISLLPKTGSQITGGNTWDERLVVVKKGDTIGTILGELGASADEIKVIAAALGPRGRDGGLKEGQRLRILLRAAGMPPRPQPIRVIVAGENAIEAIVALSDKGKYVTPDPQSMNTEATETAERDDGPGMRLYQSIYETALRYQVPRPAIDSLIRIYSYDVDFYYKTQPGDSFDVLYTGDEENPAEGKIEVMFASLTVGGETKKFYRFQTPDDGAFDYYDETGKSVKKFLVRKPLATGIMRSPFGDRNHPLLGVWKAHTGVDWGAPLGTPIYAAGNGIIEKVGWESGYGKYIRIRHANGYETAYGHMTAFARSSVPSARVRQGQVIGYVGSTGLSTGPHLHYEIIVNNRWVDPMKLKLPRGRVLEGPLLAGFEQERDRIDRMIARAGSRLAQTPAPGGNELPAAADNLGFVQASTARRR